VSDKVLEILHHVVSEMNKLKRQSSRPLSLLPGMTEIVSGDKLQQDIFRWLSPPDPWKNHNIARGSRHSETGAWFIHGNTLSEWKASRSRYLLWIHGKRKLSRVHTLPHRLMVFPRRSWLWQECPLVR
jgi:hypothetical protein